MVSNIDLPIESTPKTGRSRNNKIDRLHECVEAAVPKQQASDSRQGSEIPVDFGLKNKLANGALVSVETDDIWVIERTLVTLGTLRTRCYAR